MRGRLSSRSRWLLLAALVAGFSFIGISRALGAPWFSSPTPFPTDYPQPKRTIVVAEQQTREAAILPPTPPRGAKLPGPYPTRMPEQEAGPQGTPAGAGVITDQVGHPIEYYSGTFITARHAWYQRVDDGFIIVYSGHDAFDPSQGVVIVVRSGTIFDPVGARIETPIKAGGLQMVDAVGERLILQSTQGQTFYFDVPGGRFAASLTEVVPTMTPPPTVTLGPPLPLLFSDDAPDTPGIVFEESPSDEDLHFFIYPSGDEDWFLFHTDIVADIEISLSELPADYALYVFRLSDAQLVGSATENGNEDKVVKLNNAAADDYLVRVVGIGGASDPHEPYELHFGLDDVDDNEDLDDD